MKKIIFAALMTLSLGVFAQTAQAQDEAGQALKVVACGVVAGIKIYVLPAGTKILGTVLASPVCLTPVK